MENSNHKVNLKVQSNTKSDDKQPQLSTVRKCKSCASEVGTNDDICEKCKVWLLDEQCCFCYRPIKPDQKFCGSCGNPPKGVLCKNCNERSHFDFCQKCDSPLSKSAVPSLNELNNSPEVQELKLLVNRPTKKAFEKPDKSLENDFKTTLQQLVNYNQIHKQNKEEGINNASVQLTKQTFDFKSENLDFSDNVIHANEAFKIDNEAINQIDAELVNDKIIELQKQTFIDNQAARKFYTSLKIILPELEPLREVFGWFCNYANVIHIYGPADCGQPGDGGQWVFKDEIKWIDSETFIFDGKEFFGEGSFFSYLP